MPSAGFEPEIPAGKRLQTHALDRSATVIGGVNTYHQYITTNICKEQLELRNISGQTHDILHHTSPCFVTCQSLPYISETKDGCLRGVRLNGTSLSQCHLLFIQNTAPICNRRVTEKKILNKNVFNSKHYLHYNKRTFNLQVQELNWKEKDLACARNQNHCYFHYNKCVLDIDLMGRNVT